ncbi:PHD and RING finger domain-containing protein 1 [Hordeum vulgare]|uniref:PHD and RING finger domain-containing protein 1 n=2 Tax=Hordeum vulgare subsp. vulgare TaxID=112509 RepID=M0UU81_HORVV|nr:ABC transporter F family member 4-like [Hordeum vulgare subsp. vulgare]KAE8791797.1 PHD and RING finger domain-containing protein 1 [Hordeum vulgare]
MGTGEGGGRRRRKLEGGDGDDSDEEYVLEEEDDDEEVDELEYGRGGRDAASFSAGEEGGGSDAEYEVDDEDEEEETPRPKRPVKRNANPAAARSRRRRYEDDDDYSEEQELEEDEEDLDGEEEPRRPNFATKCGAGGQKAEMPHVAQRSNRPRHAEEEDMDFDPDLDEGEGDEDTDFDPDLEGDDDEFEDEEEEELGVSHTRTIPRLKNTVRRNPASKQRRGKKKNSNTSKVSKQKVRKPAPARRRRKRPVIEHYEDDDDFIVEDDQVKVNRNSRKKARFGRQVEVDWPVPVAEADIWPAIDSDSSEFEFGTSEDEPEGEPVRAAVRKGRKKRGLSGSSSDSEFHVLDKELSDVREEEVKTKKRVRVLQSSSDSEFHLSDKEMSDVREEVKRKKRTCVLQSSSESEFHASDKESGDIRIEETRRKKRLLVSQSSSDSEFHVSDKDARDSGEAKSLVAQPMLSVSPKRLCFTRNGGDKGKEKKELVDSGKPWCGICLSEDQRMTLQGVLNCCSHYFCFACIMEWSKVESRCPLCKRRFNTITKSSKVGLGLELKKSVIKVEERDQVYQPTEEEIRRWLDPYENLVCIECNQGGEDSLMLLCDICDSSAHTYCVGLGREVPEGNWYCGGCRLSGEGSMHPRSLTNSNSAQLGTAAPISTFGRSPSINPWQTFQGFDLNVSPRDIPRQNIHADSRASTFGASTPTGRLATLSRRRRLIHILLDRQRQPVSQDTGYDGVQHSGYAPRADPDHRNFSASSESHSLQHNDSLPRIEPNCRNFSGPWEANSSQTLLDDIRDQHSYFSSVQAQRNSTPCLFVDGNNFQHTESVNSNVKHTCSISPH